jgi:chromate transporter
LYFRYRDLPVVLKSFHGLSVVVTALVLDAAISVARTSIQKTLDGVLALAAAVLFLLHVSPALIILGAMLSGAVLGRNVEGAGPPAVRVRFGPGHWRGLACIVLGLACLAALLFWWERPLAILLVRMMEIDLFAFGGGYSALPLMSHEVVVRQGWLSWQAFMDGVALGQVTPGPIVITAAFVGYSLAGLLGAMAGAAGVFSPSFLLLIGSVPVCDRLLHRPQFRRMLRASLATLSGLMASMAWSMGLAVPWTPALIFLGVAAFAALRMKVNIILVVLVGVAYSAILF